MKPAIQVIIKDKPIAFDAALPADLKKAVSQLSLDVPKSKPRGHNTVGSRRPRASNKYAQLKQVFKSNSF